ncbi:type II toxin-antitoxin system PemK/MazF family toxin [Litoribacter populi]|uniref:type II toxin-antitoxin system PemK/MazF family toxin n=1 Tax=Litoribacter populi TaxID=2598460 RepID=UPI001C8F93C0|nr:type II toxin-antitoxin system PemK/MazF family toxin [Litoribacter populi]
MVKRFEVYLVDLKPTRGSEIYKTRPALVISPDEMNNNLNTVIIAPMTTKGRKFPTRVSCHFAGKKGQIALDQIRCVDKSRLVKSVGEINLSAGHQALEVLQAMFEE